MPDGPDSPRVVPPEEMEAARLAGWNPAEGPPPCEHRMPPPIDLVLGTNGIRPTGARRIA